MLNHFILATIVGLLGVVLHLWLRRTARRDEPENVEIERWEDEGGASSARSN
jgi:hypothetical protein